ncbi:MAG: hypothetical protein KJZ93_12910 [Caldilineaceae bacterium]|nr:hypothetical protein [Caldilineaceae bacterium]
MTQEPPLVRASEIGLWSFCQRAWWLAQVKQVSHGKPTLLAYGQDRHARHGRTLNRAQRLQRAGALLLGVALLLLVVLLAFWLIALTLLVV